MFPFYFEPVVAQVNFEELPAIRRESGVEISRMSHPNGLSTIRKFTLQEPYANSSVFVDAPFGTGRHYWLVWFDSFAQRWQHARVQRFDPMSLAYPESHGRSQ